MKGRTRDSHRKSEKQAVFKNTMKGLMASQAAKRGSRKRQGKAIPALPRRSGRFQKHHQTLFYGKHRGHLFRCGGGRAKNKAEKKLQNYHLSPTLENQGRSANFWREIISGKWSQTFPCIRPAFFRRNQAKLPMKLPQKPGLHRSWSYFGTYLT